MSRNSEESAEAMTALAGNTQVLLQGREFGGTPNSQLYITFMMASLKTPPSLATNAFVYFLAAKQRQGGNWRGAGPREHPSRTVISRVPPWVFGRWPFRDSLAQNRFCAAY